jgi:hypothetical protein
MQNSRFSIAALCLVFSGCASVSGPMTAEIEKLPVVEFGQPVPEDGKYILHFPAGVAIDTPVIFKGDLFEQEAREVLSVKPIRDIYVHKEWMSYDKHNWLDANDALKLKMDVVLPGYHHPQPGRVVLEMNSVD